MVLMIHPLNVHSVKVSLETVGAEPELSRTFEYRYCYLKALCHDIRLDCFVIASLVAKFY